MSSLTAAVVLDLDHNSARVYCKRLRFTFSVHAGVEALAQSAGATLVAVYLVDSARFRFAT